MPAQASSSAHFISLMIHASIDVKESIINVHYYSGADINVFTDVICKITGKIRPSVFRCGVCVKRLKNIFVHLTIIFVSR